MSKRTLKQKDIILDLRKADKKCEGNLSQSKYTELGNHSHSTVSRELGGWNKGKKIAGLETVDKPPRKYKVNHNYFEELGSEEAYTLGFLMGDGCVYDEIVSGINQDKDILEKILDSMDSNYPIRKQDLKRYSRPVYYFKVRSNKMVEDLAKLHLVPKKTHSLELPDLEKNLMRHYLRGYFDADGTVYNRKKGNNMVTSFVSISHQYIRDLKSFLEEEFNIKGGLSRYSEKHKPLEVQYSTSSSVALYELMYTDANIYGNRKKEKYDKLISENGRDNFGDRIIERILT